MSARLRGFGLALVALLLAGCGYRLVGSSAPGQAMWIAPVEDEGSEPLFGATLARELSLEAVNRAHFSLAARGTAPRELAVRVDSIAERGAAYGAPDAVREYLLTAEVTATLSTGEGQPLWRGKGIRADREFPAGSTVDETQANKERALQLLARDLSREILRRVSLVLDERKP